MNIIGDPSVATINLHSLTTQNVFLSNEETNANFEKSLLHISPLISLRDYILTPKAYIFREIDLAPFS